MSRVALFTALPIALLGWGLVHAAPPPPTLLSPGEIASAEISDPISIPTPGEFFAAFQKHGRPAWNTRYRKDTPTTFTSRAQLALNLGILVADGFIAVEAQDSQQVKNTGRDIIDLAKALGLSQRVLGRGNTITSFAENNEWDALREEIEATQNEVKLAMAEQQDQDLVTLVSVGAWIRGTEIVAGFIAADHTPDKAMLLRQPALVAHLRGQLAVLQAKTSGDPLVTSLLSKLPALETLVSFPKDAPSSVTDVGSLRDLSAAMVAEIATRPAPETP